MSKKEIERIEKLRKAKEEIVRCGGHYCRKKQLLKSESKQCEVCLKCFCLSCSNKLFDILVEGNVCKSHKKSICYAKHYYGGYVEFYKSPNNRCQIKYENNKGERIVCCNYACEDTIRLMKIRKAYNVRVCHEHLFLCKICKVHEAMMRGKTIKGRWGNIEVCGECSDRWDVFVNVVSENVQDNKMTLSNAKTLLSIILTKL